MHGKWLLFLGDSSLRGIYLALYQQFAWAPDRPAGVMNVRGWRKDRKQLWNAFGWIDVVLEQHNGTWVEIAAHAQPHNNSGGFESAQPEPDHSHAVNPAWCDSGGIHSRIRLTYQQLTQTKWVSAALARNFDTWQAASKQSATETCGGSISGGPHAIALQAGLWDLAARTPRHASGRSLLRSLRVLRGEARSSGRLLAYVGLPKPWNVTTGLNWWPDKSPGDLHRALSFDDDANGKWERAIVDAANGLESTDSAGAIGAEHTAAAGSSSDSFGGEESPSPAPRAVALEGRGRGQVGADDAPRIAFFDRMVDLGEALSSSCLHKCSLPSHPPHAVNAALVPSLLDLWLGAAAAAAAGGGGKGAAAVQWPLASSAEMHRRMASLQSEQCCCRRFTGVSDFDDGKNPFGSRTEPTAYWARECRAPKEWLSRVVI